MRWERCDECGREASGAETLTWTRVELGWKIENRRREFCTERCAASFLTRRVRQPMGDDELIGEKNDEIPD